MNTNTVVETFFLTKGEAEATGDPYVITTLPHYVLEGDRIIYAKSSWGGESAGVVYWYEEARTPEDYKENGYGSQKAVAI